MKRPIIIAAAAVIVALAVIALAFAFSGGDDPPTVENPPLPTAPGGDTPVTSVPTVGDGTPIPSEPPFTVTPVVQEPGGKLPPLPDDRKAEPAPIDGLDISVAESFPPQYFVHVQAGLPSGCAKQYGFEVSRDGDVITISVLNSVPADPGTICTAIYGIYELNIPLGSDFDSGHTYTVRVNDQETTFTAQ
jgi:hypothetical protein